MREECIEKSRYTARNGDFKIFLCNVGTDGVVQGDESVEANRYWFGFGDSVICT
jgi:hypothetical protein